LKLYPETEGNVKLGILSEGDKALLNIYHVMQANPEKFTKVNGKGAKAFVQFMIAPETQKMIGDFGKDKYSQPLFFPDAGKQMWGRALNQSAGLSRGHLMGAV
jgi:tungstate transport system substrate-binding protein